MSLRGLGILNSQNFVSSGEIHFLKAFFKEHPENQVIFDVGANEGNYASLLRTLSKSADIFSFEPHPKTFLRLKNRAEPKNIKSFNLGLGEKSERLKLYDLPFENGSSHASVFKEAIEHLYDAHPIDYTVDITTIDLFCERHSIKKIDLLKIDVEGNELKVLMGARRMLNSNRIKCIQFEFNELNIVSRVFLIDFMKLLAGFKFYRLLPRGKISLECYDPVHCEIFAYQNIVAVKE